MVQIKNLNLFWRN